MSDIVKAVWAKGTPTEGVISLASQGPLALLSLLFAFIATCAFASTTKGSIIAPLSFAVLASGGYAFGAVFLINFVHVYTG